MSNSFEFCVHGSDACSEMMNNWTDFYQIWSIFLFWKTNQIYSVYVPDLLQNESPGLEFYLRFGWPGLGVDVSKRGKDESLCDSAEQRLLSFRGDEEFKRRRRLSQASPFEERNHSRTRQILPMASRVIHNFDFFVFCFCLFVFSFESMNILMPDLIL